MQKQTICTPAIIFPVLAFLFLVACGVTAEPVTTEGLEILDSPDAASMPEPEYLYESAPRPDYYPPLDFEPESVYIADFFGSMSLASVLYLGPDGGGERGFAVYIAALADTSGGGELLCERIAGTAVSDGERWLFSVEETPAGKLLYGAGNAPLTLPRGVGLLEGAIRPEGESLFLEYTRGEESGSDGRGLEFAFDSYMIRYLYDGWQPGGCELPLPGLFRRLPESEAGQAMYSLPAFFDELQVPPETEETEEYYLFRGGWYDCDEPRYAPDLRGVSIGDGLSDVLARFPNALADGENLLGYGQDERLLYGTEDGHMNWGKLIYEDGVPRELRCFNRECVSFFFDGELRVGRICVYGDHLPRPVPETERGGEEGACVYSPAPQPDYYPPLDFEPESVYLARDYAGEGRALLYLGGIADGSCEFKLYMRNRIMAGTPVDDWLLAELGGRAYFDGSRWAFALDGDDVLPRMLSELSGAISLTDGALRLSYFSAKPGYSSAAVRLEIPAVRDTDRLELDGEGDVLYLPTQFERLPESEAGQAMYTMPAFAGEIRLLPFSEETAAFYTGASNYDCADARYVPLLRGVGIGESISDVLARFPCRLSAGTRLDGITDSADPERLELYGEHPFWDRCGRVIYDGEALIAVRYADWEWVDFYLDGDYKVVSISYVRPYC